VQVITAAGNTGMQSVLPAIGRESRIPDPLIAAVFSLSALLWAIFSPVWAQGLGPLWQEAADPHRPDRFCGLDGSVRPGGRRRRAPPGGRRC